VLAVAMESMSTMPYLASAQLRWSGARRGNIELVDGWQDGSLDPICEMNMGQTAEKVAKEFGIDRGDQDAWAVRSHARAARAWAEGAFASEVVAVDVDGARLDADETYRTDSTLERLAQLKPSFAADGTVTAGNASQMGDGAAAFVVLSPAAAERHGVTPQGRIESFAAVGVDPTMMGIGPTAAIPAALAGSGRDAGEVELWEINEAFASQIVQNVRDLGLDEELVNVNGGGLALAHPTGQSGCRLVVTLLHELRRRDQSLGVVSLCVGGGQGVAMVVERL
jgi:acetyl-CoA C-acetyltransferase